MRKGKTLIAKTEKDALYWQAIQNTKETINLINQRVKGAKDNLSKTDREIIQRFRAGARMSIVELERDKEVQEEILKFFESKVEDKIIEVKK